MASPFLKWTEGTAPRSDATAHCRLALSVAESPAHVQMPLNLEGGQRNHEACKLMAACATLRAMVSKGLPASEGQGSAQLHRDQQQLPAALMRPHCFVDTAPTALHMPPGMTLNADLPRPSVASAAKHRFMTGIGSGRLYVPDTKHRRGLANMGCSCPAAHEASSTDDGCVTCTASRASLSVRLVKAVAPCSGAP